MPHQCNIELGRVRGDLRIKKVNGDVRVGQVAGDMLVKACAALNVETVSGDLSARAIAGDVTIDRVHADASVRRVEGSLTLLSVGADVLLDRVAGNIDVRAEADIVANLSHACPDRSRLEAGADIRLRLPDNPSVTLEARSHSGRLDLHLAEELDLDENVQAFAVELGQAESMVELEARGEIQIHAGDSEEGTSFGGDTESFAELGEEFRKVSENFARRMEEQMGAMSGQLHERLAHLSENLPDIFVAAGLSDADAQRIAFKVRRAGERAASHAQSRMQRAAQRTQMRVEAHRHAGPTRHESLPRGRHRRRVYRGPVSPAPPPHAVSTVTTEERMMVLRMVEQGTISADEASKLLASMDGGGQNT